MGPDEFHSILESWEKNGKTQFLAHMKVSVPDATVSLLDTSDPLTGPCSALYRLLSAVVNGQLRKELVIKVLSVVISLHPDMVSCIVDIYNVLDLELSSAGDVSAQKERLFWLIRNTEQAVSNSLLRERMDIETLPHIGVVKNQKVFYSRFIKLKTKLFYKQRKFNLYREESEGYAKLLVELCQLPEAGVESSADLLTTVKSIIGCFSLDPNRVLDVLLCVLRVAPDRHRQLVPLLRRYMPGVSAAVAMVGQQYTLLAQYHHQLQLPQQQQQLPESHSGSAAATAAAAADVTGAAAAGGIEMEQLSVMTALLLRYQVFQLSEIWCWLTPEDSDIAKLHEVSLKSAHEFQKRILIISTKDKDDKDGADGGETDHMNAQPHCNAKLMLCRACLLVGEWSSAAAIFSRFPDGSIVCHTAISAALCRLIHARIDPIYRRHRVLSARFGGAPYVAGGLLDSCSDDSLDTFRDSVLAPLLTLGPQLHTDPALMHKVLCVAIAAHQQRGRAGEPDSEASRQRYLYYELLSVLEEAVLPALTLLDANCCLAEHIWSLLQHYPYHHRYRLYGTWKNEMHKRHPQLIRRRAATIKVSKGLMKRISKENVKPIGRLMGKVTHNAPGYMFEYMLSQIQIYDNLIGPMVDSLKYLTNLSYDVLGYCVIEALANPEKDRTKHDGTSLSLWLTSLASFCGVIFKKYNLDLTGLMQYVANQLKSMKSLDLLILREVVQKMTGVEMTEEVTEDQLSAMAGGELLRNEVGYLSVVRNTKRSSQRLKDILIQSELVAPLVLLMAQQRHCVVFGETDGHGSHLKLVGNLYDQCQDTMVQFGQFLAATFSIEDYQQQLPSFDQLLSQFHVGADVAFFLTRPLLVNSIQQCYDNLRKADKSNKSLNSSGSGGGGSSSSGSGSERRCQLYVQACSDVLAPITGALAAAFPARIWDDLSVTLFTTFWTLALHDLHVPGASYEKEIRRQKQQLAEIGDNRDLSESKRKKEQERCQMLADKLHEEERRQREHVERVMFRLNQEKGCWFDPHHVKSAKAETMTQLLQLCLFPRCVFSASDALYCAAFVHTLHKLRTPNFSILICYDRLFCNIAYTFSSCTEHEASRYGRFLCALLTNAMHWHSSVDVFNVECSAYPSFFTKFRQSYKQNECSDHVDFKNYRHICFKWYCKITKALITCLDSCDYVQIRNALIVLIKILPIYPKLSHIASIIEKKVEVVIKAEKNKRQDLWLVATRYVGQLRSMKDSFMGENDFHEKPPAPPPEQPSQEVPPTATAAAAAAQNSPAAAAATSCSDPATSTSSSSSVTNGSRAKTADGRSAAGDSSAAAAAGGAGSHQWHESRNNSDLPSARCERSPPPRVSSSPLSEQSSNSSRADESRQDKRHTRRVVSSRRSDRDPDEIRVVEDDYFERPRALTAAGAAAGDGAPLAGSRDSSVDDIAPADRTESKRRRTESKKLSKTATKDDDKKKKVKKLDRYLEEGEIRNSKREEKNDRKRGYPESRDSSTESKRKRDEEKIVKCSSDEAKSSDDKDRRRTSNNNKYDSADVYDDGGYDRFDSEPPDWGVSSVSSDRQSRHHNKDKHRSSRVGDGKRR